jgi:hypothetical protein
MNSLYRFSKVTFALALVGVVVSSCKKKIEEKIVPVTEYVNVPAPTAPAFRASFDYNRLTIYTPYDSLFVDENNKKTVDLKDGNDRLNMLVEIDNYGKLANGANNQKIDSTKLLSMFYNFGNQFNSSILNSSQVSLRQVTAKSKPNAEAVHTQFRKYFAEIDIASDSVLTEAARNKAGKIKNPTNANAYLIDAKGIETIQLIQKGLIGAFQYDRIANILMSDAGLNADNHHLVPGKNYTTLEHNWDEAYATFTTSKIYGAAATAAANGGERLFGAYTWEDNRASNFDESDFKKVHPAFLRGRAAIVNNDIAEVKAQAQIIKSILEKTIARAAVRYLGRWRDRDGTTPATAFHQISEGLGFIYSFRFCTLSGADEAFSDAILNDLVYSRANGLWDQTSTAEINAVISTIRTKFGI